MFASRFGDGLTRRETGSIRVCFTAIGPAVFAAPAHAAQSGGYEEVHLNLAYR